MNLGFIGTGQIASAMVEGLSATSPLDERLYLSPRGRETATHLAATYPRAEVAPDNQSVLDAADAVFLCVRPETAIEVLRGLRFGSRHLLISLVACLPLSAVQVLAPAATVVRAVPIPSARRRQSPTGMYPPEARARALFDRVGAAVEVEDEATFNAIAAATSLIKPAYVLLGEVSRWMIRRGVPAPVSERFVVGQFHSMLGLLEEAAGGTLERLAAGAATPGGLNEQAIGYLRNAGALEAFVAALDAVLARIERESAQVIP